MQEDAIVAEFTHQAEAFNRSAVARAPDTLERLVRLAAPGPDERWLEVACGPGLISRALAPHARAVHGVDVTPAMVELARREAAAAGLTNATFSVGDATSLELPGGYADGALARFTLHHVPVPGRLVEELARVVRPGGGIVLMDHVLDDDAGAAAWSQELERIRDPSHWACLPIAGLRALAERAGLELEHEDVFAMELDFEEWLGRGSGGAVGTDTSALVERALADRPEGTECFRVSGPAGGRVLHLRMWLARWRR